MDIELKEMSLNVLKFLNENEPMTANDIADIMKLSPRQINACVTKSLVRYGFAIRRAKLTRLMKKEFNLIEITDKGKRFLDSLEKA